MGKTVAQEFFVTGVGVEQVAGPDEVAMSNLGPRLRDVRMRSGMSLREVARQLGVSPSFVSQMENGKSQPSVATLYSMAQLLHVSIDELFEREPGAQTGALVTEPLHAQAALVAEVGNQNGIPAQMHPPTGELAGSEVINRSDFSSPGDAWHRTGVSGRIQVVRPQDRPRLEMDCGVIWEQLASNRERDLDFMEIIYPAGSSSTTDGRMLRHQGMEYGYLLSGILQITYGFDEYTLEPGQSMCLDPSVPHLLTNPGRVPARGIWVVHSCAQTVRD
ncbi:MAG: helix-turn-helix domain-containing protein [Actinomycetales bacterium]